MGGTGVVLGLSPPALCMLADWDFRNIERIRVMVCRRPGVEEALVEGVPGCLRRKSVRISPPLAPLG